jgi:hypothetical protein
MSVHCNGTYGLMQCHLYEFWLEIYLTKVSCVLICLQIDTNSYEHGKLKCYVFQFAFKLIDCVLL